MGEFGKIMDEKCMAFAVRIVNLCRFLKKEGKDSKTLDQLYRSGTSIGANFAEAECAVSTNDFVSKLHISLKECNESLFWLRLLNRLNDLDDKYFNSIYKDCEELKKLLVSIIKSTKDKTV